MTKDILTRRHFLNASAATLGAVTLTGCGGGATAAEEELPNASTAASTAASASAADGAMDSDPTQALGSDNSRVFTTSLVLQSTAAGTRNYTASVYPLEGQVPKGNVLDNEIAQESRFTGTGLADDIHVLALINGRYAEGLRIGPPVAFTDCNWRLIIHDSKTSRHSCHRESPPCVWTRVCGWGARALVTGSLANAFGASERGNGDWF